MNYVISRAELSDAEEILKLQKLAYPIEAKRYGDYDIPPLKQTLAGIKAQFKDHIFLKAILDSQIIGTVRAYEQKGTCYIGRLAVHPNYQNKGIGASLMQKNEEYYEPKRFELFVGSKSFNNLHLYQKLGYRIYRTDKYECGDIEISYMVKNEER